MSAESIGWVRIVMIVLAFMSGGCAGLPSGQVLPSMTGETELVIEKHVPGTLDLPPTAYPIPGSSFILFDPQQASGIGVAGILLGPIGPMVVDAAGRSEVSRTAAAKTPELVDLETLLRETVHARSRDSRSWRMTPGASGNRPALMLGASGSINIIGEADAKIVIAVHARLVDQTEKTIWRNEYIRQVPSTKPLSGPGGWLENDGALLREASAKGLQLAVAAFIKDVDRYSYPAAKDVRIGACIPPTARRVTLLESSGDGAVVRAQFNQATGSYTYILDPVECKVVE